MSDKKQETIDKLNNILLVAHYWDWTPDLIVVAEIYESRDDAHSVLLPFMFTYLEQSIRTLTSQYTMLESNKPNKKKVGVGLIKLAIEENKDNSELVTILNSILIKHYQKFSLFEHGENRNNVEHGVVHPRFWSEEDFQSVVSDIDDLSPYIRF